MALEADVTLSTGRIITHRPPKTPCGETEAVIKGDEDAEMTDAEWQEYCGVIMARAAGKKK